MPQRILNPVQNPYGHGHAVQTNQSIKEISYACGFFTDTSFFSICFKILRLHPQQFGRSDGIQQLSFQMIEDGQSRGKTAGPVEL